MQSRRVSWAVVSALWGALFGSVGCDEAPTGQFVIEFASQELGDNVQRIELARIEHCSDLELGQSPSAVAKQVWSMARGENPSIGKIDTGTVAFYGRGFNSECKVIAAACVERKLSGDANANVTLRLATVKGGTECDGAAMCADGLCIGGMDAGQDAAPDLDSDVDMDASIPDANGPGDVTPPTVSDELPANGSPQVAPTTVVSVTFSEPVQPATIAFTLRDTGNNMVQGTVNYDAATRVASFAPKQSLSGTVTYTATVQGARDLAGNAMAGPYLWPFTVRRDCPCSIWSAGAAPVSSPTVDSMAVELGVRFTPDYDGFITGVRFYKVAGNTGTHVGSLWSNSGTLLASATFTGESGSGWQQVQFSSPVPVTGGQSYVASYHCPSGTYSGDMGTFSNAVDNAPLHAVKSSTGNTNGVYKYGPGTAFPTESYAGTNYWVDVVFED